MVKEDVIRDIIRHITICGQSSNQWCVGRSDKEDFVFNQHNVIQNSDMWIVRKLDTNEDAKKAKEYLVDKLDLIDSKNETGSLVFVYLRNDHTKP